MNGTCWTRLWISLGVMRSENSRSRTTLGPISEARRSRRARISRSSARRSTRSLRASLREPIIWARSSSVAAASVSSHSRRRRSTSRRRRSFSAAFRSAFRASSRCCLASFFRALLERAGPASGAAAVAFRSSTPASSIRRSRSLGYRLEAGCRHWYLTCILLYHPIYVYNETLCCVYMTERSIWAGNLAQNWIKAHSSAIFHKCASFY